MKYYELLKDKFPPVLNTEELCRLLRRERTTIVRWAKSGKMPFAYVNIGERDGIRAKLVDVCAYLDSIQIEPRPKKGRPRNSPKKTA